MRIILFIAVFLLTASADLSEAIDELFLTGRIIHYESDTGIVKINVHNNHISFKVRLI